MSTAKDLFLAKAPDGTQSLSQWWVSICRDSRFSMVATYARAELFEAGINEERLKGAEDMLRVLLTLADATPKDHAYPSPGLQHRFDKPRPEPPKDDKKA